MRDALLSSNGDYSVFVTGPIPLVLYALLFFVLAAAVRSKIVNRTRKDL